MASVSTQGWLALVDGNGLLNLSLSFLTHIFTSAKVYLWPVMEVCSVMAELRCLPSMCQNV